MLNESEDAKRLNLAQIMQLQREVVSAPLIDGQGQIFSRGKIPKLIDSYSGVVNKVIYAYIILKRFCL